mmetsp:Transcript_92730/g.261861  ORF Transcript_92730/g.261861 Transcript_92730/m.261861 type:complete len:103 (-) Transcript_92730:120-428(-)
MATRIRVCHGGASAVLEPCDELFPFCGEDIADNLTAPGDWPLDQQCVLRLPRNVARQVEECLQEAELIGVTVDARGAKDIKGAGDAVEAGDTWSFAAAEQCA